MTSSIGTNLDNEVLPDVLDFNLRVVFCGSAPSPKSAAEVAYYAGLGNRFWDVLWESGIIPEKLSPGDFSSIIKYRVGLTDLAKYVSGVDVDVPKTCYDVASLQKKIVTYKPHWFAFNGKRPAEEFFKRRVVYGLQKETLIKTRLYVLPSTSGAARRFWDESYWYDLAGKLIV
ncbi:MAG: mismatch-specific DNA-glycosylase [Candidatus Latescibacterota bacterium]|nr:mismatch-specific DNA-glycosylase [Candidatus Latescibacterota bacterium]